MAPHSAISAAQYRWRASISTHPPRPSGSSGFNSRAQLPRRSSMPPSQVSRSSGIAGYAQRGVLEGSAKRRLNPGVFSSALAVGGSPHGSYTRNKRAHEFKKQFRLIVPPKPLQNAEYGVARQARQGGGPTAPIYANLLKEKPRPRLNCLAVSSKSLQLIRFAPCS